MNSIASIAPVTIINSRAEFLGRRTLKLNWIVILNGDLSSILRSRKENILTAVYVFDIKQLFSNEKQDTRNTF